MELGAGPAPPPDAGADFSVAAGPEVAGPDTAGSDDAGSAEVGADSAADNALVNSRQLAYRSFGSLAIALAMTGSAAARSPRNSASGAGCWLRCAHIIAACSSLMKGRRPDRHS